MINPANYDDESNAADPPDELCALLVAYDENNSTDACHQSSLPEELQERFASDRRCLDLMHRAWRGQQPPESAQPVDPPRDLGDFRILGELGRGGMGVVYEAEQLSIGRRVALKVLPFAGILNPQQLNRFKNEARAAGTLDHPHIVSVYSVGSERGVHYYAMQLIEGQSLAEVIATRRQRLEVGGQRLEAGANEDPTVEHPPCPAPSSPPLAPSTSDTKPVAALSTVPNSDTQEYFRTVAELGIQAAEALDHAHQNGIIHRDVKPANLLLDAQGKLYVTDFGLARIEADAGMTMTGDILGTLRYMSPEQALAKRVVVDHRTDIYSLGTTLYELLTLRPAFDEVDRHELLKQIASQEPKKLRQCNPRIPMDLETIVAKAMEKNPDDRYATARELADDLRRYAQDQQILARRPSLLRPVRRLIRRRPITTSFVGIVMVLALLATAVLVADNRRRIVDGEQRARQDVAAALTALGEDDLNRASDRAQEAIAQLNEVRSDDAQTMKRAAGILLECNRYTQLMDYLEQTRMIRGNADPNLPAIEQGLALYDVSEDGNWFHDLQALQLPKAYVVRVSDVVYELLLAEADHEMRWPANIAPEAGKKALDAALAFHVPTRGYYWLLANYVYFRGDTLWEIELRKLAMNAPVHHAAELFYISRDHSWGTVSHYQGYPDYPFANVYRDCREMLRFDPSYYNGQFFLAYGLASQGRHDEALAAWYGCVSLRPNDNTALMNRGAAHMRLGHNDEAIADLELAIRNTADWQNRPDVKAFPRNMLAWMMATHSEIKYRNGPRALQLAKEACELTKYEDGSIVDTLAAAYAETGEYDMAVSWCKKALALIEDAELRSESELHLASYEKAQPWRSPETERSEKLRSQNDGGQWDWTDPPLGDSKWGNIHASNGDYRQAAEDYLKAHAKASDDFGIAMRAAILSLANGDTATYQRIGATLLEKCQKVKSPVALRRAVWVHAVGGPGAAEDPKKSQLFMKQVFDRLPQDALGCLNRGLVAYRLGNWEEALRWSEKARPLAEWDVWRSLAFLVEAMAYHKLGKNSEAQTAYQQALSYKVKAFPQIKDRERPGAGWIDWLAFKMLNQEAVELIEAAQK